ncbi:ATP phosphoribosyltransferase regulatory subunit [Virgibacillus siamensis]|uniref:ATP phosphoribosyltransferase regulatory subunit n=1 Tax=Virgibacillus siamensis TaxID=480071 RepID=UPI00158A5DCD|nr:ATP phosphoribosyltransferase regulatory subunit [Virgibacillus siamensis]
MQPYLLDCSKDTGASDFKVRDRTISALKERFFTYGYRQVQTSIFEDYDLYAAIPGTIHRDDMIKVVDSSGKVLVLRPDMTIPITRMAVTEKNRPQNDARLFYVQDVFRQSFEQTDRKETTQAGIECFGENTAENDAEVIALAVHALKDLGFRSFKLEIGHAGFFKALINELNVPEEKTEQIKTFIQSKNVAELDACLGDIQADKELIEAVHSIPLLYGKPETVMERAGNITLNETMKQTLEKLKNVYELLEAYAVTDHVVFDFGLINNMNYYTGIIFQGFVSALGKPVLMGGRYDNLAGHFGTALPAIGFACDVDSLLQAVHKQQKPDQLTADNIIIDYSRSRQKEALTAANSLREAGYSVIVSKPETRKQNQPCLVTFRPEKSSLVMAGTEIDFGNVHDLVHLIGKGMENTEWNQSQ